MSKRANVERAALKARQNVRNKVFMFLSITGVIALLVIFFLPTPQVPVEKSPGQRHIDEYRDLISRISPTNVLEGFTPVHIWSEKDGRTNYHCTGGLFTDEVDKKDYILTCGHAFWRGVHDKKPARYYYQILQPFSTTFYPIRAIKAIERVDSSATNATKDVLVCIPGPSEVIAPIEHYEQNDGYRELSIRFNSDPHFSTYSTVTGEAVQYVGAGRLENGVVLAILDYPSFEGESGTIFAGKDQQVYILSRTIEEKIQKALKLPRNHRKVAMCSMVRIGWLPVKRK